MKNLKSNKSKLVKTLLIWIITFFSCIVINEYSYSQVNQSWVANYASGNPMTMIRDNEGNLIISGHKNGDALTVKYNSSGALLWSALYNYPSGGFDASSSIDVDDSGYVYTGVTSFGSTNGNYVTVKYNSDGSEKWSRIYNGTGNSEDWLISLANDNNGNTYVTGKSKNSAGNNDIVTIKYNSFGDSVWVKRIDADLNSDDIGMSVKIDNSGNILLIGKGNNDILTVKYDPDGNTIWQRRFSNSSGYIVRPDVMCIDKEDNVLIYGLTYASPWKGQVLKYDSTGNLEWTFSHDTLFANISSFEKRFLSIQTDKIGNVFLGSSGTSSINSYFRTIKLNSSGIKEWERIFREESNKTNLGRTLSIDEIGNVFVTGYTLIGNTGGADIITIKYKSDGSEIWKKKYIANANYGNHCTVIADSLGNVFVNGPTNSGMVTIKYSQPLMLDLTAFIQGFYDSDEGKMIEDTVTVFLRNSSSPFSMVDSSKGILDSNGKGRFYFSNGFNNIPYYLCVDHRNSIKTWSSSPVSFTFNEAVFDFTASASQAFGDNQALAGSKFCIYNGDVDRNGVIDAFDVQAVDNDAYNSVTGYVVTDLNGDSTVDGLDINIVDNNNSKFVALITPQTQGMNLRGQSQIEKEIIKNEQVKLEQNSPNPFNPVTSINFQIPVSSFVNLKVYDLTGREVATLVNNEMQPGIHSVSFNASNLSSGVYYYKLETGNDSQIKKMTLIK